MSEDIAATTERRRSVFHVQNVKLHNEMKDYPKSVEDIQLITHALQSNEFLKNILTDTIRNRIVNLMAPLTAEKGQIIIEQNDMAEFLYVSQSGVYQVLKNGIELHRFDDSIVFGEIAIIYNHTRHATVKALSDGKLWVLHKHDYTQIMIKNAVEEEREVLDFLRNVPMLCEAPEVKLKQAIGLFNKTTFRFGTDIVREGDKGDDFYIIRAGTVKVFKKSSNQCLAMLNRGQYFGEHALLKQNGVRQATVTADSTIVECLVLHYAYFINLFGGLTEFLQESTVAPSIHTDIVNNAVVKLHDLKVRATIGQGGYARVQLTYVKTDDKKQLYALKYMHRKRIVKYDLIEQIQREKAIQIRCQSQFIVRLYNTYNDRRYLYLLQEYCPGGDLLNVLQRNRAHYCKEPDVKFVAACVLEAIGYLHKQNFIFRDIKPENLLLDRKGYVKLTDFGCARLLVPGSRTFSMHGAPEYLPPEFIYQRGYDRAVDLWACGILMFELLVGHTPFKTYDRSHMQTYNLIVKGIGNVKFPSKVSKHAVNIIQGLCNGTPHERLGYCTGIQEIRCHKWYHGFDWIKLRNVQITSPFVIKLSHGMDTKYFDKFQPDTELPPTDDTTILNDF